MTKPNVWKTIRLRYFRLNQKEFARLVGVEPSVVCRIESGRDPAWATVMQIRKCAQKLGKRIPDRMFFDPGEV